VIIITLNEAGLIEQCLRSLPDYDELIVVDSGSTDGTQAICKRFGAKLLQTDWPGFGPQKNRALDLAQGHWVLSVDADEQFDASLRAEISRVTGLDKHEGSDSDKATGNIREDMGQVQAHAIVNAYRFRRRSSFAGQYCALVIGAAIKCFDFFAATAGDFQNSPFMSRCRSEGQWANCLALCCISRSKTGPMPCPRLGFTPN
jgi:glycosyltransferase involved in cell wall biosynthesis